VEVSVYTLILVGSVLVGAPALKDTRKPARAPSGDWTVRSWASNGLTVEYGVAHDWAEIGDRDMACPALGGSANLPATFFAADGPHPAHLDIGPPGDLRRAIWRLDGDELTICVGEPGAARPADFGSPKGSGQSLVVLRRSRPRD
jgi:uncharacterized protein (TIGR03067 family)